MSQRPEVHCYLCGDPLLEEIAEKVTAIEKTKTGEPEKMKVLVCHECMAKKKGVN